MQVQHLVFSSGATSTNSIFAELPASFQLKSATVTQNGASVGASGVNYKTLTISDNGGNTIATATTVAGWTPGVPVDFTLSVPSYAVLTAGQRFQIAATHTGAGAEVQAMVTLNLEAARG